MLKNVISGIFYEISSEYHWDFKYDCLEKNINRFSILPFFNIITQITCIFIYLYVYPVVYPEQQQIDVAVYLVYSAVYCLSNALFVSYFIYLRRHKKIRDHTTMAGTMVYLYIMSYVILESSQVVIELAVSGNLYRFLATFFIVAFFPLIGRWQRLFYMASYIIISDIALVYLNKQGVNIYSYAEINLVIFIVCLIASYLYYSSVIRNFELRKKLEFLSMKDELTGLSNRRFFNQNFEHFWKIASRGGDRDWFVDD